MPVSQQNVMSVRKLPARLLVRVTVAIADIAVRENLPDVATRANAVRVAALAVSKRSTARGAKLVGPDLQPRPNRQVARRALGRAVRFAKTALDVERSLTTSSHRDAAAALRELADGLVPTVRRGDRSLVIQNVSVLLERAGDAAFAPLLAGVPSVREAFDRVRARHDELAAALLLGEPERGSLIQRDLRGVRAEFEALIASIVVLGRTAPRVAEALLRPLDEVVVEERRRASARRAALAMKRKALAEQVAAAPKPVAVTNAPVGMPT